MGRKEGNKVFYLLFGIIVLLVVAVLGLSFNSTGDTKKVGNDTIVPTSVDCSKDYEKAVSFVTRNSFEKGVTVNNVTYKVWKVLDGVKVPQPDAVGELTVAYGESYEVVAMADGFRNGFEVFGVDKSCNGPTDKVFYLTALPTSIDSTFENSKITGPNAVANRIPVSAEETKNVKATFNGMSKTSTDAIIVFDSNKDEYTIDSSLTSASLPQEHTTLTGYKSYAFKLGQLSGSSDVLANFDVTGDVDLVAGDYNLTYTIYQYQTGFVSDDSGEYVNVANIEGNDVVLLPTFTGDIYLVAE